MQNYYLKAFSLLEVLLVMTLVVLLVALAVPSYRYLVSGNRAQIYANELVASLEFARTYAIKTGEAVVFCGSKSRQACDGLWREGVIAMEADNFKILKILTPIAKRDNLSWHGAAPIIFNADGLIHGRQGSFYYCAYGATKAIMVILNSAGIARVSDRTHDGREIPCIYK